MKSLSNNSVSGFITLTIPFIAMFLMIGINIHHISGKEYRFSIEGFDPRDILRGHYLTFRYKWPEESADINCNDLAQSCCACITGETESPAVSFMSCGSAQDEMCPGTVEVSRMWGGGDFQPQESLRQYYIPEAQAFLLENMLRDEAHRFKVGLVPRPDGDGQLKMLYVDGEPLPRFLSKQAD